MKLPKTYSLFKDGVTQSLLGAYLFCAKRFLYIVNRYSGPSSTSMEFGTLMHHLIEQWYLGMGVISVDKLIDAYEFPKEIKTDEQEKIRAISSVMMPAYMTVYSKDLKNKIIQPEIVLDTQLMTPVGVVRIRGKIDGVVNRKALLETKTKGRIDEEGIEKRLKVDWQSMFYLMGYRLQTGVLLTKVIYNVIRTPGNKVKGSLVDFTRDLAAEVAKKPEYYFMRWETEFTAEEVDAFQAEVVTHCIRLSNDEEFNRSLCACEAPYPCNFLNACATGNTKGLLKKDLFSELKV